MVIVGAKEGLRTGDDDKNCKFDGGDLILGRSMEPA